MNVGTSPDIMFLMYSLAHSEFHQNSFTKHAICLLLGCLNGTIIIWKNKLTKTETCSVQIKHIEHALICLPDGFFKSESCGLSSFSLYRCLWMLSCDQIPHWDADEGPTCFRVRLWLWRQPPGLFVLLSVISAHHLEQRLTGSPPFHKQLHSHFAFLWCVYLCKTTLSGSAQWHCVCT